MLVCLLMKKTIRNFSLCPFPTLRLTGSFSNFFKRGQNEDEIINAKLSKLNITTLSEAAQKSLWAAVFIKKIMADPPSYDQLQKQSLRQELLNLKLRLNIQLNAQIQKQMKDYFALDGGVVINGNVYNQGRFKDGKKKGQEKLVFYPTHTTTGHMFRNIFHDRYWNTLLLYGRWGIGKSLAIVLAAMLSNLITEFNCNNLNTPEAALIQQYLGSKPLKIIYWSMKDAQTKEDLLQIIISQIQKDFPSLIVKQIGHRIIKIKDLSQQQKEKLYKLIQKLSSCYSKQAKVVLVIDQINRLVSHRRQHRKIVLGTSDLVKQLQPGTLQKSKRLYELKNMMQESAEYTLYNSSSNIQKSLIVYKQYEYEQGQIKIGDGHTKPKLRSFDYESRISQEEGNIGFLQLSQYFSSVLQQMISLSPSVQKQWDDEDVKSHKTKNTTRRQFFRWVAGFFRETKWIIIPNALKIRQQIKEEIIIFQNCKSVQSLRDKLGKFLQKLQSNLRDDIKQKISNFSKKEVIVKEDNSQHVKRRHKLKFYAQFLNLLEDIIKNDAKITKSIFFQIERTQKNQVSTIFFEKIKPDSVDRELFTVHSNQKQLKCFMNPVQLRDLLTQILIQQINQLQQQDIVKQLSNIDKALLGVYFEKFFMYAFTKSYFKQNQLTKGLRLYSIDKYIYIPNLETDSFLKHIHDQLQKNPKYVNVLFLPDEFKQVQSIRISKKKNQGFEFLIAQRQAEEKPIHKYYFFDLTVSKDVGSKIRQFLNLMAKVSQFKTQFNDIEVQVQKLQQQRQQGSITHQELQKQINKISFSSKLTKMYKGKIVYTVINLSNITHKITKPEEYLKISTRSSKDQKRYLEQENLMLRYRVMINVLNIEFQHINCKQRMLGSLKAVLKLEQEDKSHRYIFLQHIAEVINQIDRKAEEKKK